MASSSWLDAVKSAKKACLVQDGRRKVHYTFADHGEMVEEYDVRSNNLLVRKWKKTGMLGGEGQWQMEVGEDARPRQLAGGEIVESNTNPIFSRTDAPDAFQWRVRNLPYPLDTYSVTADEAKREFVIRTTNKKYYKRFNIPDLDRMNLRLQQEKITTAHANNTLIVNYKKPKEVLLFEKELRNELSKVKASKDGDVDCAPS